MEQEEEGGGGGGEGKINRPDLEDNKKRGENEKNKQQEKRT